MSFPFYEDDSTINIRSTPFVCYLIINNKFYLYMIQFPTTTYCFIFRSHSLIFYDVNWTFKLWNISFQTVFCKLVSELSLLPYTVSCRPFSFTEPPRLYDPHEFLVVPSTLRPPRSCLIFLSPVVSSPFCTRLNENSSYWTGPRLLCDIFLKLPSSTFCSVLCFEVNPLLPPDLVPPLRFHYSSPV